MEADEGFEVGSPRISGNSDRKAFCILIGPVEPAPSKSGTNEQEEAFEEG
jgi:hypothetical protein